MAKIIDSTKSLQLMTVKSLTFYSVFIISAAATAGEQAPVKYSEFQHGFMKTIVDYKYKYTKAENELQKSSLVADRNKDFQKLKGDPRRIKDWIGVLESMGTNGDGKAYVVISLSPPPNVIKIATWNNSFSDAGDMTRIPQSSQAYANLSTMRPGNFVKFSGQLKRPTNITEAGKMTEPTFLFKFSNIEKVAESASK